MYYSERYITYETGITILYIVMNKETVLTVLSLIYTHRRLYFRGAVKE